MAHRDGHWIFLFAFVTVVTDRLATGLLHTLLFAFLQGTIVPARGRKHFGWDPIFQPKGFDQTYAELDPAVKNSISHRARALQALKEHLQQHEEREREKRGEQEEEEEPKIKRPKTEHH